MRQPHLQLRKLRCEPLEERRMLSVTWVVNTANDYSAWVEDDSTVSLREAVTRAGDNDVITFSSNLSSTNFTIKYGELKVNTAITIDASNWRTSAGVNRISLDASSRSRIFNVGDGASLTLTALNLKNGYSAGDGGAIYTRSLLEMNNCTVMLSGANYGAGIYSFHGDVFINGGSITYCTAQLHGGGIYAYHGTLTVDGCLISNNSSQTAGGLDCSDAETIIRNSVISNNKSTSSDYFAGGIFVHGGWMSIYESQITGNVSYNYGGGMYIHDAYVWAFNTLIADNSSTYTGGGIENFGWLELTQCTIAGNKTTGSYSGGAGIYNYYGKGMYVKAYNCIIAENTSASGKDTCNYEGNGYGYGYNILTTSSTDWMVQLNFSVTNFYEYDPALPLFTDIASKNYTLAEGSQAVNLGNENYLFYDDGTEIEYDLAGERRINGDVPDLGAYEYYYHPQSQLPAPTGVTVSSAGANRVRVKWNEVADCTGYTVQWSTNRTTWSQGFSTQNNLRIDRLTYGTTYYFRVQALGDAVDWSNSEYSAPVGELICPVDIDGDDFIGPGDNAILSAAWFSAEGDANWDERCDIDGDGFIGPGDRSYLSANWFAVPSEDSIINPPALALLADSNRIFESLDDELEEILLNRF